ncbi:MAG: probable oxidoreductase FAD/NAD(P)-binding [Leptospirillum rubarum]|jgi:ferredoxin-NADP reductase|uniref:Probable oxidoreductase FAD/NAD(P)-binding n=1 Tax=Leptospirillum sp. Group II '5-way CG' TaxID=419541 RepID=B6AR54_9BACT|nr:MAG: probable oxidoreductase FAD/NAD(P)-binding [Leptospirillum rubarum]EDZ38725.1 MAG: Probable oxidoreductase FAD/NAD(P)-binding [Leptospirillum sp. Group II '5-way CG']
METVGTFFRKGLIAENTLFFQVVLPPDTRDRFDPGQYAHLEWASPESPEEKGDGRDFSIASPPEEWPVLSFATRLTGSSFKKHLENAPDGTPLRVSGPYGEFTLPPGLETRKWNQPIVFIAGGIGITPFRSMLHHALGKFPSVPFFLFTTNRSVTSIPFLDELRGLARQHKNLFLDQIVSRTEAPLPPGLESGILTPDRMFEAIGERAGNGDYYIAGTPSLVSSFVTALSGSHILPEKIHADPFFGYL